jgi:hypothetical protein
LGFLRDERVDLVGVVAWCEPVGTMPPFCWADIFDLALALAFFAILDGEWTGRKERQRVVD